MRYFKTYVDNSCVRKEISYDEAVDLVLRYYNEGVLEALDQPGVISCMFSFLEIEEEN